MINPIKLLGHLVMPKKLGISFGGFSSFIEDNPFTTAGAILAPWTAGQSLTAGVGIDAQVKSQNIAEEQADEAKKQSTIKNAIAGLKAQRARSETLRSARIAGGQVKAQGAVTGTQESSSVVGGLSGLSSTTAGNIGFSLASSVAGWRIFESGQKIFDLEKKKGRQDLIAGVSSTLFDIGVAGKQGTL